MVTWEDTFWIALNNSFIVTQGLFHKQGQGRIIDRFEPTLDFAERYIFRFSSPSYGRVTLNISSCIRSMSGTEVVLSGESHQVSIEKLQLLLKANCF